MSPLSTLRMTCAGILLVALCSGCASSQKFTSADQAVTTLVAALRNGDQARVHEILGPEADDILSSGDAVADRNNLQKFLNAYDEKHQFEPGPDGSKILDVGKTDWPMPIPLAKDPATNGWYFDVNNGKEEMLNRRIGRNELYSIQVCRAIVDAQREYASADPEHIGGGKRVYAQRFISEQGKKNGLYWPTGEGEPPSPLGTLGETASKEGYVYVSGKPSPYHGYYYRILKAQGANAPGGAKDYLVDGKLTRGFAVLAYPATYGNSGIKTFIVSNMGILYEADLGPSTADIASRMTAYDPGPEWSPVKEAGTVISRP